MTTMHLAAYFAASEANVARFVVRHDGALAGAVIVREPWLLGPYLQFLGLLPGWQGQGLGRAILDWMDREAPAGARNLWLCVTASNDKARGFYEKLGFTQAAALPDLVADGKDEILMRRQRVLL